MCRGLATLPTTCIERAKEMKVQLGFLLHKPKAVSEPESVAVTQQKVHHTSRPSTEEALGGGQVFDKILSNKRGVTTFGAFLRSEFSEENLEFWLACEDYRSSKTDGGKLASKARRIYQEFITTQAPKEVNLDSLTRATVIRNLDEPSVSCFLLAQDRIRSLMENDSFPRFLKSHFALELIKHV